MSNATIQQGGAGAILTQSATYGPSERADLERLIEILSTRLGDLSLDRAVERKVESQVATLKAQMMDDEPDRIVLQQVGRTLRNVLEGTISGVIAAGIAPTVWPWVLETVNRIAG
jgi:hypothetical protein